MKKLILTVTTLICLGYTSVLKAQQLPQALNDRLQKVFDSVCTKYRIKGASGAVLIPNAGIWKSGYGESHAGTPVTPDMLLCMGSNTKTHVSALLLKMQENQLLSLDDTIGKWIQGYPNINGQITIRQCLNHTSGLFDYLQNAAVNDSIFGNPGKIWTLNEILWLAKASNFTPGTGWDYSNTNYIVAGIIIRDVLNKPFQQSMRDLLLAPNGLNNTIFYGEPTTKTIPHAWSVVLNGSYMEDLNTDPLLVPNLFSLATTAGAMVTTAEDNVQFWHKLISGQLLGPASMNEMLTYIPLTTPANRVGYGLGIFRFRNHINNRTIYTHGGTFFGFINENMVDSVNGTTVSVLTNQDSIDNNTLLVRVVGALHRVTLQMPVTGVSDVAYNSREFTLYPNPAADLITVKADNFKGELSFVMMDMTGKQCRNGMVAASGEVNIETLDPGLYVIYLRSAKGEPVHMQKIRIAR